MASISQTVSIEQLAIQDQELVPFSGVSNVFEWFETLDNHAKINHWTDSQKILRLKESLVDEALKFYKIITRSNPTYEVIRERFISEFVSYWKRYERHFLDRKQRVGEKPKSFLDALERISLRAFPEPLFNEEHRSKLIVYYFIKGLRKGALRNRLESQNIHNLSYESMKLTMNQNYPKKIRIKPWERKAGLTEPTGSNKTRRSSI